MIFYWNLKIPCINEINLQSSAVFQILSNFPCQNLTNSFWMKNLVHLLYLLSIFSNSVSSNIEYVLRKLDWLNNNFVSRERLKRMHRSQIDYNWYPMGKIEGVITWSLRAYLNPLLYIFSLPLPKLLKASNKLMGSNKHIWLTGHFTSTQSSNKRRWDVRLYLNYLHMHIDSMGWV